MFPYYQFLNHYPQSAYFVHSPLDIHSWKINSPPHFDFLNPLYQPYHQLNPNHQQIKINHPSHSFQPEKTPIVKNQTEEPLSSPLYNQQFSKSPQNILQNSVPKIKNSNLIKIKTKQIKRKVRMEKKDKAYVAKQYPKQQPSIKCRYIQKNFQLNIINQVFSFLWTEEKSHQYTKRYLKDDVKVSLFYEYMKIVRKFSKRYINKEYLKNLCDYQPSHIAFKMVTKNSQKLQYFSIKEFSFCVRHLIAIYLNNLCPQAILTSKKMRRQIWGEHLSKCRLLRNFLFHNMSQEEYQRQLIRNDDYFKMIQSTEEENEPSKQSY